ncbi:hypothetical protein [Denitromonas ohlonensis]|uniref:Uncharacterized protein n=2 Tax=Denitromonas TaxID=139331 RepID=A0A557RTC7_9RHOO|nr:hypothetical protein [Denitromonas ohlonensis]TVO68427.1 hypothetical protein FHP90_03880 [Denitromonas ohlonensis]TVO74705.1 hypothetical protein FHP89_15430 [Denitromonas ohlonensis]
MKTPTTLPTPRRFVGTLRAVIATGLMAASLGSTAVQAQVPQIPAFLPSSASVPAGAAMDIDGEWMINTIGKRIRFEGGRAYAVDSWLHMFVLQVQPGMVVIQNIQQAGDGRYVGDDLPLLGRFEAVRDASGVLDVTVASVLGTIRYQLQPVSLGHDGGLSGEDEAPVEHDAGDDSDVDDDADD